MKDEDMTRQMKTFLSTLAATLVSLLAAVVAAIVCHRCILAHDAAVRSEHPVHVMVSTVLDYHPVLWLAVIPSLAGLSVGLLLFIMLRRTFIAAQTNNEGPNKIQQVTSL